MPMRATLDPSRLGHVPDTAAQVPAAPVPVPAPATRRVRTPEGKLYVFPADATDAEISEFLNAPPATGRTTPEGKARSWVDTAKDIGIGAGKGLAETVTAGTVAAPMVDRMAAKAFGREPLTAEQYAPADEFLQSVTKAENAPQMVGKGLEIAAEMVLPARMGARAVRGAVPSRARAGEKFQRVMRHAQSMPVDVSEAGDVALRIQDLADRGGSMPMVVRKFLRRVTDPNQGDLTYREARDFLSNISRLSADESKRLTPVLHREIAKLRVALNASVQRTADIAGMGPDYMSAMKEYRRASRGREAWETVVDTGKKAAITGAVGGAGYGAAKMLGVID